MASFVSVCSQVTNLFLGINEGNIALYKISWNLPPIGSQVICVQYKVSGDPTWINASTNLSVDIYGNISGSVFNIITSPISGTTYDIQAFNQCGSLSFQTTFTFQPQIYSNAYLIDNAIYNICGNDPVILYSSSLFGVGTVMYEDIELTTVLSGYTFITSVDAGFIYGLNAGTGEVGAATVYSCRQQTSNSVILGNNAGTICSGTITTVYSNGAAIVGGVLYTDLALSVPVTGFDYVLFLQDNVIYNLNNVTGVIGADTGSNCNANGNLYIYSIVASDLINATENKLYTPGSFGKGAIMSTDYALTTPLTGYNYISLNGEIRTINSTTGEVGCLAVNC